jgi:acetyl/propionyl-CoA carboxylase alpha subunit
VECALGGDAQVKVKVGQDVKKGQPLLVLSAMKVRHMPTQFNMSQDSVGAPYQR